MKRKNKQSLMKFLALLLFVIACFGGAVSAETPPMIDAQSVQLQALDKSTARKTTLEVKIGETVKYGSLFIKAHACREANPLEKPENAAFLQIWEVPINAEKSEWVFSGWMFASSPALSAMDHPVYDVWVLKCLGGSKTAIEPSTTVEIEGEDELVTPSEEEIPANDNEEITIGTILDEAITKTTIQE